MTPNPGLGPRAAASAQALLGMVLGFALLDDACHQVSYHVWGEEHQSTLAILVRTEGYEGELTHNHIVPRKQFAYSSKDCNLVSDHSINAYQCRI